VLAVFHSVNYNRGLIICPVIIFPSRIQPVNIAGNIRKVIALIVREVLNINRGNCAGRAVDAYLRRVYNTAYFPDAKLYYDVRRLRGGKGYGVTVPVGCVGVTVKVAVSAGAGADGVSFLVQDRAKEAATTAAINTAGIFFIFPSGVLVYGYYINYFFAGQTTMMFFSTQSQRQTLKTAVITGDLQ
jgi:hypothetical protein